jgi:hypothetical protein
MIRTFRLRGLSNPKSGTLELLDSDRTTFWARFDMPKDRYDALFKWAKNDNTFWRTAWIVDVECESLNEDGTPYGKDLRIVDFREWDLYNKPWDYKWLNQQL